MKRAKILNYFKFDITKKGARFYYRLDKNIISFFISLDWKKVKIDDESKNLVLSHIGLSLLIDLAVICFPKKIKVSTIKLSKDQINFWRLLYNEAALERCYIENSSLEYLDTLWESKSKFSYKMFKKERRRNLTISMSGGKESLTALKIFEKYPDVNLFFFDYNDMNSYNLRKVYSSLSKKFKFFKVSNNFSHTGKLMKQYEVKDYSLSVIAQIIFSALLFSDKIDYFLIGNEYSSNFGTTRYKGKLVNHQFDKTLLMAEKFNTYIKEYFNGVISYTSPFFGMYEYKIAKIFFKDNSFLDIWTSCNNSNSRHNFCCNCPKCAFIYIISLPFTKKETLDNYFYKNPLANLKLCRPLIDFDSEKPDECVGEKKECWVALNKLLEQQKSDSITLKYFQREILPRIMKELPKMEAELNTEHTGLKYLPKELTPIVNNYI